MKNYMKNKGAALIAVLIGILFIAILASSLLYMSTVNFKMKSMRQYSSDTFYSSEFALNEMMSQIKQFCSTSTDPAKDLKTKLNAGSGQFDRTFLQKMIHVDSSMVEGLESIKVSSIYDGTGRATYHEDGNYIYLYGVTVTAKTDEKHGSYESSITTDITFGFPPAGGGKGKINDFSILSDCPLEIESSDQYIGGDIYMRANGSLGEDGTEALRIGEKGVLTMLSRFAFIDGDITVANSGILYTSGNCIVRGNIDLGETGTLVVGGNLYVKGTVSGGIYSTVGSGKIHQNDKTTNWKFYETNYSKGLAAKLISETIPLHISDSKATLTGYDGTYNKLNLTQAQFCAKVADKYEGVQKKSFTGIGEVGAVYSKQDVIHTFTNSLVLLTTECHFDTSNGSKNCTFINVAKSGVMKFGIQDKIIEWGTMSDKQYEKALTLLVKCDLKEGLDSTSSTKINFAGDGKCLDDIKTVDGKYKIDGNEVVKYDDDCYYNKGWQIQNYIPYGKFLNDKAEDELGGFMGGVDTSTGGTTGIQPTIFISNWTKE